MIEAYEQENILEKLRFYMDINSKTARVLSCKQEEIPFRLGVASGTMAQLKKEKRFLQKLLDPASVNKA